MSFELPPPPADGQLHRVLPPTQLVCDDDYIEALREEIWRLRRVICTCGKGDATESFHAVDCLLRLAMER